MFLKLLKNLTQKEEEYHIFTRKKKPAKKKAKAVKRALKKKPKPTKPAAKKKKVKARPKRVKTKKVAKPQIKKAVKKKVKVKKLKRVKAKVKRVKARKATTKAKNRTNISKLLFASKVGIVTHYFPKARAAVIKITDGSINIDDKLHIKGPSTDFKQKISSMQINNQPIKRAQRPEEVGIQVRSMVRANDTVYKLEK